MTDRHDRFLAKNNALGRAWEMEAQDKAKARSVKVAATPKLGKCEKCGKEKLLTSFRSHQTDRTEGAASYGTVTKMLCEDCKPKKKETTAEPADPKLIKSLLRGARKGLR